MKVREDLQLLKMTRHTFWKQKEAKRKIIRVGEKFGRVGHYNFYFFPVAIKCRVWGLS